MSTKGSSGKKKDNEAAVASVMEKTGWTREKTVSEMRRASEELGISFKFYDSKDYHLLSPTEQREAHEEHLRKRAQRDALVEHVCNRTGWTGEYALKEMRRIKSKFGISFTDFSKYGLYRENDDTILEAYNLKITEKNAVKARRAFIADKISESRLTITKDPAIQMKSGPREASWLSPEDLRYENCSLDKQPDPIIAACYYLGIPLPSDASPEYQPSSYVHLDDVSLDSIRSALGESSVPRNDLMEAEFTSFSERFGIQESLKYTDTDLAIYFTDYLMHCKDYGFLETDYFSYRFYLMETDERVRFLGDRADLKYVRRLCNKDIRLFWNKGTFNRNFPEFVRRKWLAASECSYEDFSEFIHREPRFFAKPIGGMSGISAGIMDIRDHDDHDELFRMLKGGEYIIEECVQQHPLMASMNASSLNTIRVYTLVDEQDKVNFMGAVARFGRRGSSVDNFHQGGVCALVDIETGDLLTDALDIRGVRHKVHPDSEIPFKGFRIPCWDKVLESAAGIALKCKDKNRHVGWDVSIRSDGCAEIIEGNSAPSFDVLQAIDHIGKADVYLPVINRMAESMDMKKLNKKQPVLDVSDMYR